MARSLAVMMAAILVAFGISACGGGDDSGSRSAPTATTTAEQPAASGEETSDAAEGDAAEGKTVFADAGCAGCHSIGTDKTVGPGLAGITTNPKLANGKPMTDENLSAWIKEGGTGTIGTMPPQSILTDSQLADLVAYMKTLN